MTLTDFLLARIAEDGAWAKAAIQSPDATHWHWVNAETDTPIVPDPFTQEYVTEGGDVSLRTVEEVRSSSIGDRPLPDFVIWSVDDVLTPGAAGHIARHDPARVLAECEAKRRIVERCAGVDYAMPSTHLAHGILAELALPYAEHPDYRQEWKP